MALQDGAVGEVLSAPGEGQVGPCLTDAAHRPLPTRRSRVPLRLGPNACRDDHCGVKVRWCHAHLQVRLHAGPFRSRQFQIGPARRKVKRATPVGLHTSRLILIHADQRAEKFRRERIAAEFCNSCGYSTI